MVLYSGEDRKRIGFRVPDGSIPTVNRLVSSSSLSARVPCDDRIDPHSSRVSCLVSPRLYQENIYLKCVRAKQYMR